MGNTSCRACPACRPTQNCCKPEPVRVRRTSEDDAKLVVDLNKANQLIAVDGDGFASVDEYLFYRSLTDFYASKRKQQDSNINNGTTPAPPLHPPPPRSVARALRRSLINGDLKQEEAPIIENGVPILPILQTVDVTPVRGACFMGNKGSRASVPSSLEYPQSIQELQAEKARAVEDRLAAEVKALEEQHKKLRNWHRKEAGDLTNGRAGNGSSAKLINKRAFSEVGVGRKSLMLESPAAEIKMPTMSRKRSSNTSLATLAREDDGTDVSTSNVRQSKRPKSRSGKSDSPNTITRGMDSFRFGSPESKPEPETSGKRKFLDDIMTDPNNFVDEISVWNWELRVQDPQNRFEPQEQMFVCSNHTVGLVRNAYARQKNKYADQVRFYAKEGDELLELDDNRELQHYPFICRHKTVLAIIDVAN